MKLAGSKAIFIDGDLDGKAKEMGALEVSRITRRGTNFVGGVAGLGMNLNAGGSRSWVPRARVGGIRRDMELGGYPDVTLAQARDSARAARAQMKLGLTRSRKGSHCGVR